MQPADDSALLRQYAENHSNDAFSRLVERHINLVYSIALRQVSNPHDAEEITQAVFVILARKAAGLRHKKALSSWLFQTTRLTANNFVRSETRRHHRDQEAYMQSILNQSENDLWPKIAPLLDTAVASLRDKDRQAILLRYYQDRNLHDVGLALGASEDAAEKRVSRALGKLRKFFAKRGVSSTAVAIAAVLSSNSVHAAPITLAKSVTVLAVTKGAAATGSTLALIEGTLKLMAWTQAKLTIGAGAGTLVVMALAALMFNSSSTILSLSAKARFGPVHEIFLDDSGKATFLDLDTGHLFPDYTATQRNFDDWTIEKGVDIALPKLVSGKGNVGQYKLGDVAIPQPGAAVLKEGVSSFGLKYARYHNWSWNRMSAAEILHEWSGLTPSMKDPTNEFVLSGTYLFQTRQGGIGIMQISQYTAYPLSMKIRYKLIQTNN